jgi:hypothetical protein
VKLRRLDLASLWSALRPEAIVLTFGGVPHWHHIAIALGTFRDKVAPRLNLTKWAKSIKMGWLLLSLLGLDRQIQARNDSLCLILLIEPLDLAIQRERLGSKMGCWYGVRARSSDV